ncbi:MAG: hypothetical protein KatS3mg045_0121 [Bellilinea sp.]|nr:MAG: hypothetical protein KatS3mg045_0121 [Bellilinea sp.]
MINNPENSSEKSLGYVVGGSLKDSLSVRLTVPPQEVKEGSFVVIESGDWRFYGTVTDLQLGSTNPRFADEQSENRLPPEVARLLHGQTLFTNLQVLPALMQEVGPDPASPDYERWRSQHPDDSGLQPQPVKTVPAHHALVRGARAEDVANIFGEPGPRNFVIGYTREQNLPIPLDLEKFVQRSSGIFGATGTGKSFLTRLLLAGLIEYNKASTLVFDMHNEYAYDDIASDTKEVIPGLKSKFNTRVRVVGLGAGASIRGQSPDFTLTLAESDILPEDIEMLTRELNLRETTPATLEALWQKFGREWFSEFKKMRNGAMTEDPDNGKKVPAADSVAFWANQVGVNVMAAESLHQKLGRLFNKPYIVPNPPQDSLAEIINLLGSGKHVILSFGEHESDLDYLLVTNLITRRIREEWEKRTNAFRSHPQNNPEPRPLVVVIEEAHKLLNREMAAQTAFATIAREMRKYYVTLLIVDQRPSQIYDEVMSQLGTRVSAWLGDETDIAAVLSGLAGRDALRGMLARLQPKEEALLLGWGVSLPIVVRSRRYDQRFFEELHGAAPSVRSADDAIRELFG